jgi:hypothetical protein
MLMRDGIDLRTGIVIDFVDDGEGESVEVIDAKPEVAVRAAQLAFDETITRAFELSEKCVNDWPAGMLYLVERRICQFGSASG